MRMWNSNQALFGSFMLAFVIFGISVVVFLWWQNR